MIEAEVLWGRRAFATAQSLLSGVPFARTVGFVATGWHDTTVHAETGSFAVVRAGGSLDDLIGEVLQVTRGTRSVFVYCLGSADVPTDLSLARRAFLALAPLSVESTSCIVEAVA